MTNIAIFLSYLVQRRLLRRSTLNDRLAIALAPILGDVSITRQVPDLVRLLRGLTDAMEAGQMNETMEGLR